MPKVISGLVSGSPGLTSSQSIDPCVTSRRQINALNVENIFHAVWVLCKNESYKNVDRQNRDHEMQGCYRIPDHVKSGTYNYLLRLGLLA